MVAAKVVFLLLAFACTRQHDPRADWQKFEKESQQANQPIVKLTDDGKLPAKDSGATAAGDSIDAKYQMYCSSCHGAEGKGDGPAGAALNPKPRNFTAWKDPVTDEDIAKIIRDGGAAWGKSANMAKWSGVLNEEQIAAMVKKIRTFRGE